MTPESMIERVGRATAWHGTMCSCAQKIPCNEWCRCAPAAARVIAVLRKPTAAMLSALSDAIADGVSDERKWQRVIDAALSPPPVE